MTQVNFQNLPIAREHEGFKIVNMKTYSIILAGGKGERFWPISRRRKPKQVLNIFTGKPLVLEAYERARKFGDVIVITSKEIEDVIRDIIGNDADIIAEPVGKNTAPAIYWVAKREDINPEDILFVTPSDHIIGNIPNFVEAVNKGIEYASKGHIVVFGIKPTRPESGYGYIEAGEELDEKVAKVKKFYEKPSIKRATEFVKKGNFYWNSGMFVFSKKTILEAFERYAPDIVKAYESSKNMEEFYYSVVDISIDYAIMEKAKNIVVVKADFYWEDAGAYTALERIYHPDASGNTMFGKVITKKATGNIIYAEDGIVATYGVKDMIIVHTKDATLVIPKKHAQKVKELVEELKKKHLTEYL